MDTSLIVTGLIFGLAFGIAGGLLGGRKGLGQEGFFLGFFLGPVGLLIALLLRGNRRPCPACRELMHAEATVCPRCRRELSPKVEPTPTLSPDYDLAKAETAKDRFFEEG